MSETILVVICALISLPYCTEFGYYYLGGVDRGINNVALVFVVWSECVFSTTIYRYRDVLTQVVKPAFLTYNAAYFPSQFFGIMVAHLVSPGAGAGLGFGMFFFGLAISLVLAKTPSATRAPKFWNKNVYPGKVCYLAFYSGNAVRHDLIAIIGKNGNWRYPFIWAPFLRYLTSPILAIVFSLAYPEFGTVKNDPVHIFGFIFAHVVIILILGGFVVPKWFDIFAPPERLNDGVIDVAPNVMRQDIPGEKRDDSMASVEVPKEGLQRLREGSGHSGSTLRGSVDGIETEKEKGDAADGAGGVFRDPVVQKWCA